MDYSTRLESKVDSDDYNSDQRQTPKVTHRITFEI